MKSLRKYILKSGILIIIIFYACTENWDDHNAIDDQALNEELMTAISKDPDLSSFATYLAQTGYDSLLKSSKLVTVFAPVNSALANIDKAITDDPDSLKKFISNHISYGRVFTYSDRELNRIKMISGKNISWLNGSSTIDENIRISGSNKTYKNGVLQVIDKPIELKQNAWEFFSSFSGLDIANSQRNFIKSLSYKYFDRNLAKQIGVDPNTGVPVYEEGSGYITRNSFLNRVRDLSNEDSVSTFFVLTDEAYELEVNKLKPFFITDNPERTDSLSAHHLIKDLAIRGLFKAEELPDTLLSMYSVKIPIDKNAIVASHKVSNGIVHVLNKMDFRLKDKFPPIVIEGESALRPADFSTADKNAFIHYRIRQSASGGMDLRIWNQSLARMWIKYTTPISSVKYKVYWRAANDFNDSSSVRIPMSQRIAVSDPLATAPANFVCVASDGYVKILPGSYENSSLTDTYLGEYTPSGYETLTLYIVGGNSTTNYRSAVVLDYLKLVPVLE